jgi:predicted  nucleic acid-binding Zn-ribbon protein
LPSSVYVETSRLGYLTPTDYSQTVEDLRRQMDNANSECAVLVRTNERAEQAHSLAQQQLQERRQQIADLQHQIDALQRQNGALRHQHDTLQHQHDALQHQHDTLQHQLADYKEQITSKNQLIERIHASTSWRVTAPLRAFKYGLGGRQ